MPTPSTELDADVKNSRISVNVESRNDNVSNLVSVNSSSIVMDTFTTLPIDFDSSNSSIETMESVEESLKDDSVLPMLTDIAEETVYDTEEFLDETLKMEEKSDSSSFSDEKNAILNNVNDTSAMSIQSSVLKFEKMTENEFKIEVNDDSDFDTNRSLPPEMNNIDVGTMRATNGVCIASSSISPSTTDVSSLITISNNTNLATGLLEIAQNSSTSNNKVEVVSSNHSNVYTNIPNVIQVNSVSNTKLSTLKPITIPSTPKFVPISIAPNTAKRPANISIGQPSSNVVTKVIVSQGKVGQPYIIANAPKQKSFCVLPTTGATSSPVKSITVAQAKQMGIKLQPLRPSATKPLKQKIVLSSMPPGAQVLKKIQPVPKTATPTKILPAPLVSSSSSAGQPTKIFLSQDYVMKGGTLVPKQPGGQVITISNLQSGPMVSNHVSPKKQVQYIKLINNVGSTNVPTVTTPKAKITTVTSNSSISTIDKDTPIIVASAGISAGNLNLKSTSTVQTSKTTGTSNITVLPVIPPSMKNLPGQRLILPAVTKSKVENSGQSFLNESNSLKTSSSIVVLPDNVMEKLKGELLSNATKPKEEPKNSDNSRISQDCQENLDFRSAVKSPTKHLSSSSFEAGSGLRSRKPCNCTRSQCLKLYCECFANGEFCNNCNCVSCHNNISHEENRQHAIKSCLDRNPQAFRPKIGKCLVGLSDRRHTKGCHCKRSGCLKNYCECYEAQIPCSENCKCIGCKNIDEMLFATSYSSSCNNFDKSDSQMEFQTFSKNKLTAEINDAVGQSGTSNPRHAFSFIKDQVVEATCQCLLAQADEVKRRNINVEDGQKYILEEFGRCLIQIIECAPDKYNPS